MNGTILPTAARTGVTRFSMWLLLMAALLFPRHDSTAAAPGCAPTVDLANGNSGSINGALYVWTDHQPTGTGVIVPFVRIQRKGTEQGYNTSGSPLPFDEKDPLNFTHDAKMKDLGN